MCGATHRAPARRHAVTDELTAPENIEKLELQRVGILAVLHELTDNDGFNTENRPIVEIDLHAGSRFLQHVVFRNGREPATAGQICTDDFGDIERHVGGIPLPPERNDRDRPAFYSFRNNDIQLRICHGRQEHRDQTKND